MLSHDDQIKLALEADCSPLASAAHRREDTRFIVRDIEAHCRIIHPGGTINEQAVPVVDCSAHGLRIVWPGFVHIGTKVETTIRRAAQDPVATEGTCRWCRLLSGSLHSVGIRLNHGIPVRELVSHEAWLEACESDPEQEHPLVGRALIFAETNIAAQAARFQLSGTKLATSCVTTRGEFIDAIERGDADILLIDADDEGVDATELLDTCRARHFAGPIILLSMDQEIEYLARMDALGSCRAVLVPMQPNALTTALRDILREHPEALCRSTPIYSTATLSKDREQMLNTYIDQVNKMCAAAIQRLEAGHTDEAVRIARAINATGGSVGYAPLSDAAQRFLEAAGDPAMAQRLPSVMQTLQSVALRLEPKTQSAA